MATLYTRALLIVLATVCSGVLLCATAGAAPASKEGGLQISPVRQFLSVDAGHTVQSSLTVANLSNEPMHVTLSVKQFSVTDYVYNYQFTQPTNDWLRLSLTEAMLAPHQTKGIAYVVSAPSGSMPGGRYYTLFASATTSSGGFSSTIQAADLLYLTVNGKLIRSSHLADGSMPRIAFGRSIPYTLQPLNTGNIYFFAYVSAELHGLFVDRTTAAGTHMLMPGKIRSLSGSIPSPVLPGVYRASYGYKTDSGQTVRKSQLILYVPPWSIAFALIAALIAGKFLRRRASKPAPADESNR